MLLELAAGLSGCYPQMLVAVSGTSLSLRVNGWQALESSLSSDKLTNRCC
jgi:hypothetical protein